MQLALPSLPVLCKEFSHHWTMWVATCWVSIQPFTTDCWPTKCQSINHQGSTNLWKASSELLLKKKAHWGDNMHQRGSPRFMVLSPFSQPKMPPINMFSRGFSSNGTVKRGQVQLSSAEQSSAPYFSTYKPDQNKQTNPDRLIRGWPIQDSCSLCHLSFIKLRGGGEERFGWFLFMFIVSDLNFWGNLIIDKMLSKVLPL